MSAANQVMTPQVVWRNIRICVKHREWGLLSWSLLLTSWWWLVVTVLYGYIALLAVPGAIFAGLALAFTAAIKGIHWVLEVLEETKNEIAAGHHLYFRNKYGIKVPEKFSHLAKGAYAPKVCAARQYSDMMSCTVCELDWDVNDAHPPKCKGDI